MKSRQLKLRSQWFYAEMVEAEQSRFNGIVIKFNKTDNGPYVSGKIVKSHLEIYHVGFTGTWTNPLTNKKWKILDNFEEKFNE